MIKPQIPCKVSSTKSQISPSPSTRNNSIFPFSSCILVYNIYRTFCSATLQYYWALQSITLSSAQINKSKGTIYLLRAYRTPQPTPTRKTAGKCSGKIYNNIFYDTFSNVFARKPIHSNHSVVHKGKIMKNSYFIYYIRGGVDSGRNFLWILWLFKKGFKLSAHKSLLSVICTKLR